MSTSKALRDIFKAARPLIGEWLDVGEQIAALRDTATAAGLDWSAVKALIKAQIQDERDNNEGKRVTRILEKAEFASTYADMLGFAKMNEKSFSAEGETLDVLTSEITYPHPHSPAPDPSGVAATAPESVGDAPVLSGATASTAASVSEPRSGRSTPGKDASWTVPQASHADNREVVTGPHRESGETNSGVTGGRQLQPALRTEVALGAVDTLTDIQRTMNAVNAAKRTHNPETHFLNSAGLLRLHGCQKPEHCGGTWRQRCFGCQKDYAEAHGETA